jgi:transcriptional regulator with XRE-family HTH domain
MTVKKVHDCFIEVLTQERKKQGISHEKLAALAGIHRTAISHIENKRRNPTLMICLKLANALGISFATIAAKAEKLAKPK